MIFFDRQDRARRQTGRLVVLFTLAVAFIVVAVQAVVVAIFGWERDLLLAVGAAVVGVILIGSWMKMAELAQGGGVIAEMLGGQLIQPSAASEKQRQLLNVVEEMALASGLPVPLVYLLPEKTINAFAAGNGPGDAVIGVTDGCLSRLTRDELQGVIAHEFSHILNGDMRLNLRLIGVVHGILALAIIGRILLELGGRSRSTSSKKDGGAGAIALVGLALWVIGYIGVFFGNLIRAAVSRQREFLADAAAVQFTRNPAGISGALYKIGKYYGLLKSPRAAEASHLYFGEGLPRSWFAAFATHPPIEERIRAIHPGFDPSQVQLAPAGPRDPFTNQPLATLEEVTASPPSQPATLARVGAFLAAIPAEANLAIHEPHGACAIVYALLLDDDPVWQEKQLAQLDLDETMLRQVRHFVDQRRALEGRHRIELVDLVLPALRQLSPAQYHVFQENVQRLIAADGQVHLFEFVLQKMLFRHLELSFTRATGPQVRFRGILPLLPELVVLLSALAAVGQLDEQEQEKAYQAGIRELMLKRDHHDLQRKTACGLTEIGNALDRFYLADAKTKNLLFRACEAVVRADGHIGDLEIQLLRAIADAVGKTPPVITGADV